MSATKWFSNIPFAVRNDGKDTVPGRSYEVDLYVDGTCVSFDHGTFDTTPGDSSIYGM